MSDKAANDRVYWHSRRGMLELDLVLMPYAKEVYPDLSAADKAIYRHLLDCEDTELLDWLLQKSRPGDEDLASIMDKIIAYAKSIQG